MIVWIIVPKADNDFCLGYSYTNRKYYDIHKTKSENDDILVFSSEEKANKYLEINHLSDKYKSQDCWKMFMFAVNVLILWAVEIGIYAVPQSTLPQKKEKRV